MEMGKQKDRSSHQHDTHLDSNIIKFVIIIKSFKTEKKNGPASVVWHLGQVLFVPIVFKMSAHSCKHNKCD